ncbi:hypothetical protein H0H93_010961 [Arthromyces matolae]|nr:hypothetical protein H0H93_010961 [Arthromyces matolae]
MSLDQNLFTLHVTPNKDNPHLVDLIDPSGTIHYQKLRLPGAEYKMEVYGTMFSCIFGRVSTEASSSSGSIDPIAQSLLITVTAPNAASKAKTLELYNPTIQVDLKYTGTLSFRWGFKWEEHEFEWKREECFMLRKPDPPVLVAVTKEPAGRLKTTTVQILDYNLNRFDVNDRKGLEIVILTALLTFADTNEAYHTPQETMRNVGRTATGPPPSNPPAVPQSIQLAQEAPPPPPKPAPKTGVERIAEMQATLGEYNEITVGEEGQIQQYAEYCSRLLEVHSSQFCFHAAFPPDESLAPFKDEAMLFVTIRSGASEQVPKVLQVVEETKRIRHKAGLEDAELHQYVVYDTAQKKGPRRINLDDNVKPTTTYTPPTSLTVHLSKIDMPELQPKPSERPSGSWYKEASKDTSTRDGSSSPGRDKGKDYKKKENNSKASRPTTPPTGTLGPGKLNKHGRSPSPAAHVRNEADERVYAQPQTPLTPTQSNKRTLYAGGPPESPVHPHSRNPSASSSFPSISMPSAGATSSWERPTPTSYNSSPLPQSLYGPGSYAPSYSSPSNTPYAHSYNNSGYNPSYTSPLPPPGPPVAVPYLAPPSPHPPASHSHAPTTPTSSSNKLTGLFDSFRRR